MTEESPKVSTPAYVPFKTFSSFINGLSENGIPSQIDKSIMRNLSGSVQSALVSTLEYLKLIDKAGKPAPQLTQLVESKEKERADILRSVLENAYPFLFSGALDLKRATSKQVEEAFRLQGAAGSTAVKCIAFFLAAAKEAGVQISSHVKTPQVVRNSPPKRSNGGGATRPKEEEEEEEESGAGTKKLQLPLPGKGNVIFTIPADLTKEDWDFLKPIFEQYMDRLLKSAGS